MLKYNLSLFCLKASETFNQPTLEISLWRRLILGTMTVFAFKQMVLGFSKAYAKE